MRTVYPPSASEGPAIDYKRYFEPERLGASERLFTAYSGESQMIMHAAVCDHHLLCCS